MLRVDLLKSILKMKCALVNLWICIIAMQLFSGVFWSCAELSVTVLWTETTLYL